MLGKPRRGAGHRNMDCADYEACLDLAAKRDWKSFNCENCEHGSRDHGEGAVTTPKKENTRLCDCGKITLSPNCPYCPSCMAKLSRKGKPTKKTPEPKRPRGRPPKKQAPESLTEAPIKEKTTQSILEPEKPATSLNTTLVVEFGKYASVLREIEKLAEDQMRPVDLQIIYMLKTFLNSS